MTHCLTGVFKHCFDLPSHLVRFAKLTTLVSRINLGGATSEANRQELERKKQNEAGQTGPGAQNKMEVSARAVANTGGRDWSFDGKI